MAGFMSTKAKRKDFEEVYDEFSEFSLYSPARKIRRLDAELPPIMEEEDQAVPLLMPEELAVSEMVDAEPPPLNEERALVLYKPMNSPLILSHSPTNLSFRVNPDLVDGLKNQAFWAGNHSLDDKAGVANSSLAVVPWVPAQAPLAINLGSRGMNVEEPMEAEEVGGASMEVEESKQQAGGQAGGVADGFQQWQQHCMIPQPPQNATTPIMWSWG